MGGYISKSALVIEDSKNFSTLLSKYLIGKGYEVSITHDGMDGYSKFCSFSPGITFIDIVLPGMDGIEVAELIKNNDPEALVVIMSSYMSNERLLQARELNADWLLLKPFNQNELYAILEQFENVQN